MGPIDPPPPRAPHGRMRPILFCCWELINSKLKWLPSKPAEITLISQWAQYWQYTSQEHTKPMLFGHWDLSQH